MCAPHRPASDLREESTIAEVCASVEQVDGVNVEDEFFTEGVSNAVSGDICITEGISSAVSSEINKNSALKFRPTHQVCQTKLLRLHETVKKSGKPNMLGCRIPLDTCWNIKFLKKELSDYVDKDVAELCEFG